MLDVKITVIRKVEHRDLKELYENPITHTCDLKEGQVFISHNGEMPSNFCPEAWKSVGEFAIRLAKGETNFFDGWMKNPKSALISCNDGFRPVSFLLEVVE